jgi:hypothetical protein
MLLSFVPPAVETLPYSENERAAKNLRELAIALRNAAAALYSGAPCPSS